MHSLRIFLKGVPMSEKLQSRAPASFNAGGSGHLSKKYGPNFSVTTTPPGGLEAGAAAVSADGAGGGLADGAMAAGGLETGAGLDIEGAEKAEGEPESPLLPKKVKAPARPAARANKATALSFISEPSMLFEKPSLAGFGSFAGAGARVLMRGLKDRLSIMASALLGIFLNAFSVGARNSAP